MLGTGLKDWVEMLDKYERLENKESIWKRDWHICVSLHTHVGFLIFKTELQFLFNGLVQLEKMLRITPV